MIASRPKQMLAARWHGRLDVRVEQIDLPEPANDEALIEVLWCGICGTDLEEYRHGPLTMPATKPHPRTGRKAPLVLGHEIVGRIAVGAADGSGPPVGAVVVPDVVQGCGACWWCARHEEGLCPTLNVLGQTDDGGLARYFVSRADRCLVVPDGLDPRLAALAEPTAVAIRAVAKLPQGMLGLRIAVLGAGTIGLLVAQVARAAGARSILAVDPLPARLELARSLASADGCTPANSEGAEASLPEPHLDAVFECSGRPGALALALRLVRPGGTVVAVGLGENSDILDPTDLVLGEKRLLGTAAHMYDTDVAPALDLIASGRIDVAPLITHEVPLADVVSTGLAVMADVAAGALKVLIDCRDRDQSGGVSTVHHEGKM